MLDFSSSDKENAGSLDGISFYQQLFGDNSKARDWIFCHYYPNWGNFEPKRYVQNKEWKLYDNGELYNLETDILEKNPLSIDDQSPDLKSTLDEFTEVLNNFK